VRSIEPAEARRSAEAARAAAAALLEEDASLGASVLAHGIIAVAEHALRAAEAREEERRLRVRGRRTGCGCRRRRLEAPAMTT